jgi:hypothetical protein
MTKIKETSVFTWSFTRQTIHSKGHVEGECLTYSETGYLKSLSERAREYGIENYSKLMNIPSLCSAKKEDASGLTCTILNLKTVDGNPVDAAVLMQLAQALELKIHPSVLDDCRRDAANKAYDEADFGPLSVTAATGWEDDGENRLVRKVFFETIEGPSRAMQFSVEFEPGRDVMISDAEFELPEDDGNLVEYKDERPEF